jgi:ribosome-binding protein aMBF1 (putative translation factor)
MRRMTRRHDKLTDQIRRAIDESGVSRYRLWKETGIDQATLSRFMAGKAGMTLKSLDVLADALRLRVVAGRSKRKAR